MTVIRLIRLSRKLVIPKDIMEKVEEGGTIAGKGAEGDVRGSFSKYADLNAARDSRPENNYP